jgi:hypothetical protein
MTSPPTANEEVSDFGSHMFDFFANFQLYLDGQVEKEKRQRNAELWRRANLPVYIRQSKMSSPGAAVTDIIDFDGPRPGRQWIVRLLTAFAQPLAANAAIVTWYVGQNIVGPAAGMLPSTMAVWQFPSVPTFQSFTSDIITIMSGEHLLAGLTGIPASSNIALSIGIHDQPLYSASEVVTGA